MGGLELYPRAVQVHLQVKSGRTVNAMTVSTEFEISHRHAQRIFAFLRDTLHAPLIYDRKRQTYAYVDPTFELPVMVMAEGEAVGLVLAHEALLRRQATPLARHLHTAIERLRALLPDSVSVNVEELLHRVTFSPVPARPVADSIMDGLARALESRRTIHIEYYSATGQETTVRDVDVYHLTHMRGDWYAVGWCHLRQGLRTFALSRIRTLQPLSEKTYQVPQSFSIIEYFRDSVGVESGQVPRQVVLHFDREQAVWVRERLWHYTQSIEERPDGSLLLQLNVSLSMELRQWILSYGRHVVVLEPPELRDAVVQELAAARRAYPEGEPVPTLKPDGAC